MTLRLNGSTSGYTEIDAPASAGNNTLVLPTGNGVAGNILGTDGAGNLSWVNGRMVLATAQATTSGTVEDFTGIPSWVKRITVMGASVSVSGAGFILVQLGTSAGFQATGYLGGDSSALRTTGFSIDGSNIAAATRHFVMTIVGLGSNGWVAASTSARSDTSQVTHGGGSVTLSGTLDRLRLTTTTGTDTFDSGSVNILYEG